MKTNFFLLPMAGLVLIFAGCQRHAGPPAAEPSLLVSQFSANKGLFLPDATRQSLGLEIVDVAEQSVPRKLELHLRVYHPGPTARASGSVTARQAEQLPAGTPVRIQTPDGQSATGQVLRVSSKLQSATGAAEVLVEFADPQNLLPPGTFITATISLGSSEEVLTIPRAALLESSEGDHVYTVSGDHFVRTPVQVGARTDTLIEIEDGLYAGDQVVARPVLALWLTELAATKGGQACCIVPGK